MVSVGSDTRLPGSPGWTDAPRYPLHTCPAGTPGTRGVASAAELARSLEVERARVAGLEAELAALRVSARLPWWRRLLPLVTGAPATLPEPTGTGSTGGTDTP